ncbi:MAG: PLP-dependent aminotransferase family protein, partial [Anaerolineales bacterium]|nr:PLP-dependent aminotransferase family protein [Anaerolineales bacterium]
HQGISDPCPFRSGVPALDAFPFKIWERLVARRWRKPSFELLCYGHVGGYRPLQEAIAAYLGATRGVRCRPEQVIVVTGAQQGMYLATQLLLDPGDGVWVEDPGYPNARRAMQSAGAKPVPVPVDGEGIDVATGMALDEPGVRMAVITPSYQYPLGVSMSLGRRLELLEWAGRTDSWILEDDYDSEYRYAGRPLAALQGLDQSSRVIYVGTFSKVLYPSLRVGYLIVPSDLIDPFTTALAATNRNTPPLDQAALADFISEGHFARHIRRMRMLYAERQVVLVRAVNRYLAGRVSIAPADAGLHLIGWLDNVDDRRISKELASRGIYAAPLTSYATRPLPRGGLILGYAGIDPAQIEQGVILMAKVFDEAS